MKKNFYVNLAWTGIKKNKKYYVPYIIVGVMMVMMFYLMNFMNASPLIRNLKGGQTIAMVFGFGTMVIAVFALIYLFYTNSFLVKIRNREYGLYSILGMNKRNIICVNALDSVIVFGIVIIWGLFCGLSFSKLVELCLCRSIEQPVSFGFTIDYNALENTIAVFLSIYTILFVNSICRVSITKALDLLHDTSFGEKDHKGNALVALTGLILLLLAYYEAITIKNPVLAISVFSIAVVMVIIATYMLFIAGSVALCKILQKNKKYYYSSPSHFISTSTMRFRMKRNGAGLASICILMTMVIVMMSLTVTMHMGMDDAVNRAFSTDLIANVSLMENAEENEKIESAVDSYFRNNITNMKDVQSFPYLMYQLGMYSDAGYKPDTELGMFNNFYMIDEDTYRRIYHEDISLDDHTCLVLSAEKKEYQTFTFDDTTWNVQKNIQKQPLSSGVEVNLNEPVTLVIKDFSPFVEKAMQDSNSSMYYYHYTANFQNNSKMNATLEGFSDAYRNVIDENELGGRMYSYSFSTKEETRKDYVQLFGGILVMCALLSILFLVSAVMILYYKQISEGFEDQKRFAILKKVGMTKKEIRNVVNSQVLFMFFMPLVVAVIHLCAAFPMLHKILILMTLNNLTLSLIVTGIVVVVFAMFYAIVYKLTSNAYFSIVNASES